MGKGYTAGMRHERIMIQTRKEAKAGTYGLDDAGVEWGDAGCVWASVSWAKGMRAMNAGALDVYGVIMVRMNWNNVVTCRSRIVKDGVVYQILPETFHADRRENTVQLQAQAVIEEGCGGCDTATNTTEEQTAGEGG